MDGIEGQFGVKIILLRSPFLVPLLVITVDRQPILACSCIFIMVNDYRRTFRSRHKCKGLFGLALLLAGYEPHGVPKYENRPNILHYRIYCIVLYRSS